MVTCLRLREIVLWVCLVMWDDCALIKHASMALWRQEMREWFGVMVGGELFALELLVLPGF